MWPGFLKLITGWQLRLAQEAGQDIVEYALVICLIAASVTAFSGSMAIVLTTALSNIATAIGT